MSLLNAVSNPLFAVDHQFAIVPRNWFSEAIAIDSRIYEKCFNTAIPSFILSFRIFFPPTMFLRCKLVLYARAISGTISRKSNRAWLTNRTYLSVPRRILREETRVSPSSLFTRCSFTRQRETRRTRATSYHRRVQCIKHKVRISCIHS